MAPPYHALGIVKTFDDSSGVPQSGCIMFKPTMQELLNIELFFHYKRVIQYLTFFSF